MCFLVSAGPVSLLSMWTNRITTANSRKHQEFVGRASSVNNKFELYQHLKDENGFVHTDNSLQRHHKKTKLDVVSLYRMDVHENGKATR